MQRGPAPAALENSSVRCGFCATPEHMGACRAPYSSADIIPVLSIGFTHCPSDTHFHDRDRKQRPHENFQEFSGILIVFVTDLCGTQTLDDSTSVWLKLRVDTSM